MWLDPSPSTKTLDHQPKYQRYRRLNNLLLPRDDRILALLVYRNSIICGRRESLSKLWWVDGFFDERVRLRREVVYGIVRGECHDKTENPSKRINSLEVQLASKVMFGSEVDLPMLPQC